MANDRLESWRATANKRAFNNERRRAYGIPKHVEIGIFVAAKEEWTSAWEAHAVQTISQALDELGLARMSILGWRRDKGKWSLAVQAEGIEAQARLKELIAEDEPLGTCWGRALVLWSSESDATNVLAEKICLDADDVAIEWPLSTSGIEWDRELAVQTLVFHTWG